MGAQVWQGCAGDDGPATKTLDMSQELVYYDSRTAKRTCVGRMCNLDCCFPNVYKITSERVLYAEWDIWYLCDTPLLALLLPFYCCRGIAIDLCPSCTCLRFTGPKTSEENEADRVIRAKRKVEKGCLDYCCFCPTGRSALFWDIDLMSDIGAKQKCSQILLNEGNLKMHRMAGGDADSNDPIFIVRNVPEVFSLFDDFSYELSQMDLSHFRQNAMGQKIMAS